MPKRNKSKNIAQKPRPKKSKKGRRSSRKNNRRTKLGYDPLHPCTMKYFAACVNGFSQEAYGACIPVYPSRASDKYHSKLRGTMSIGTAGNGFIAVAPCLANDTPCVFHTINTFPGTTVSINTTNPTVGVFSNSLATPFTKAQYVDGGIYKGPSVAGRIIGGTLRWRYTGTNDKFGGQAFAYVSPDHSNLHGVNIPTLGARDETVVIPCSRSWSSISISGNDTEEIEYPGLHEQNGDEALRLTYPLSSHQFANDQSLDTGGVPLVMMFAGAAGVSFEFQYIQHMESHGALCANSVTRNHIDITGLGHVQEAVNSAPLRRAGTSDRTPDRTAFEALKDTLRDTATRVASNVGAATARAAADVVASQLRGSSPDSGWALEF